MIYRKLQFCDITQSSAIILRPFVSDVSSKWYKELSSYNSGCDIQADTVYSLCSGVVLQVGTFDNMLTVTIQYDANTCVRYAHLKNTKLRPGQLIRYKEIVGSADKFVRVEVAQLYSDLTMWPVRIGNITYYKVDPESYVDGSILLPDSGLYDK